MCQCVRSTPLWFLRLSGLNWCSWNVICNSCSGNADAMRCSQYSTLWSNPEPPGWTSCSRILQARAISLIPLYFTHYNKSNDVYILFVWTDNFHVQMWTFGQTVHVDNPHCCFCDHWTLRDHFATALLQQQLFMSSSTNHWAKDNKSFVVQCQNT